MKTRALLIGSPTEGLQGCANDLARMKEVLSSLECAMDVRLGPKATRASILEGYRALIDATGNDDAAIFYYSGHGGIVRNPDAGMPGEPSYHQCIVPWDHAASRGSDFRGITAMELSGLLAELTAKTKNVTVILDCCHSARMSRHLGARPRALRSLVPGDVRAHLAELRAKGVSLKSGGPEGNPDAVRLVACGMLQVAWEYESDDGEVCGAMTEAFQRAFQEAKGSKVTWEALGRRVRDRVMSQFSSQRPEIEGPLTRYLFSTEERRKDGRLGVVQRTSGVFLQGGLVLDVRVGDIYEVTPQADDEPPFARGVVKGVGPSESPLAVDPPDADIPDGAQGVLVKRAAARAPIAIEAPEPARGKLAEAVEACRLTRVADQGERPLATLRVQDDDLAILDAEGDLLAHPRPVSEALEPLGESLRSIAVADAMRKLRSLPAAPFPESACSVTWGVIENGEERPYELAGATLKSGDRMFVRLENRSDRTLYFTVFDIGVSQKVSLISDSLPSGVPIERGAPAYVLGLDETYVLTGWAVHWPEKVPVPRERKGGAREEELVVIITDRPQDFRPAETAGVRSAGAHGRELTEEERDFEQLFEGTTRDVKPSAPPAAYRVVHIPFYLEP